jgi:uncharacterized protein
LNPELIDQRKLYSDNSVLRGQQPLVESTSKSESDSLLIV